ncbi:MAG: YkvA family protein [Egibacteraceae bacterium]
MKDLATHPRVPWSAKLLAGLAAAYLVSPVDLVPDFIPVIGQLDDLGVALLAVRWLIRQAGFAVIYESWRGSDEGLALVLTLAGVEE